VRQREKAKELEKERESDAKRRAERRKRKEKELRDREAAKAAAAAAVAADVDAANAASFAEEVPVQEAPEPALPPVPTRVLEKSLRGGGGGRVGAPVPASHSGHLYESNRGGRSVVAASPFREFQVVEKQESQPRSSQDASESRTCVMCV
jgi:hypothetical protein